MSLTPQQLAAVEAASARVEAHRMQMVGLGCATEICCCTTCDDDRVLIARHAPATLSLLRDWMNEPQRSTSFGDLD